MNFVFFWTDGFDFKKYFILLLHILHIHTNLHFYVTLFLTQFLVKNFEDFFLILLVEVPLIYFLFYFWFFSFNAFRVWKLGMGFFSSIITSKFNSLFSLMVKVFLILAVPYIWNRKSEFSVRILVPVMGTRRFPGTASPKYSFLDKIADRISF